MCSTTGWSSKRGVCAQPGIVVGVVRGDPRRSGEHHGGGSWAQLDVLLARDWPHESGGAMPILAMAIDTGFQRRADGQPAPVYEFARRHPQPVYGPAGTRVCSFRTVIPVKGNDDAFKLNLGVSGTDAAQKRQGVRIWTVGRTGRSRNSTICYG